MHKQILRLALPNIVTNITVPLLGMVDLAIVGRLGDTKYIGAIAIATMIFNMIYWLFGFLRMGTSGFTAQAYGAGDIKEAADILLRSLLVGLSAAICLIVSQKPIIDLAMGIVSGSNELKAIARRYFFCKYMGSTGSFIDVQLQRVVYRYAKLQDTDGYSHSYKCGEYRYVVYVCFCV